MNFIIRLLMAIGAGIFFIIVIVSFLVLMNVRGENFDNNLENIDRSKFILIPLETRVIGSNKWINNSLASLRVITMNHDTGEPIKGSRITARLTGENLKKPIYLFRDKTNEQGTIIKRFRVPAVNRGRYEVIVDVSSDIGSDTIKEVVMIKEEAKIMLTTDKPLYQPNQVIHMRALALMKPLLKPAIGKEIIFEVIDSKGNKLFKKVDKISRFGVASAKFQLADEINMGTYLIKAFIEDEQNKQIGESERKVNVQRYVLPKFKVQVKAEKTYYMPNDTLRGDLKADYFFGKPVADSKVTVKFSSFDVGWNEFSKVEGVTNNDGLFDFEVKLPGYFAGIPLEKGNALIKIEATVVDKAEHQESGVITVLVAKDALIINAIPENIVVAAGLINRFFILTSYPNGEPAKCKFTVDAKNKTYTGMTDENGVGQIEIMPQKGSLTFSIMAKDKMGNIAKKRIAISDRVKEEAVLLQIDKVIAKVGDNVKLNIYSTKRAGTVFIDLVHDKQTYLTKSVDCADGKAFLDIEIDEGLVGTNLIHAYQIMSSGEIVRDSKIIYVNPAKRIQVSVYSDKESYLPGKEAELKFSVTDGRGHPILSALGINIVDESVFTIEEMHPGLEKIYFTLEQELLKPKYEIHGLEASRVVIEESVRKESVELNSGKQRIARVLFAAAMPHMEASINVNTYTKRAEEVRRAWEDYVRHSAERIWKVIERYRKLYGFYPKIEEALNELIRLKLLTTADVKDPLGNAYLLEGYEDDLPYGIVLVSGGLDGKIGTSDDVYGYSNDQRVVRLTVFKEDFKVAEKMVVAQPKVEPEVDSREQAQIYVRKFFPETLFVNPQLITDANGKATLKLKMADSITTWRTTVLASSVTGQLGSTTFPMKVFQDFFIDIDLPISLTQNDEVAIPVAIYNYLPKAQSVRLKFEQESWFDLLDKDEVMLKINSGDVSVRYFRIRVKEFGHKQLTIHAYGEKMSDAIRREIEVIPDGREIWETINDKLEADVEKTIIIPKDSIEEASNIIVKVYPGAFSQVIEGLDKLLRMPFGCFEQTSSVTYPNILVLDYMKKVNKINPEIQMKAEQYINLGYQRLLTFEVRGGGFSWFGEGPANKVLTAYGVMEFSDMSKVYDIDPNIIKRTVNWLVSRQSRDGSWNPDEGGIAEGVINRQTDTLRTTAYIAWSLVEAKYKGKEINNAAKYISSKIKEVNDAYALAVIVNALVGWNKDDAVSKLALEKLADMATEEGSIAYWKSNVPTSFGGKDTTGDLETTALAAYGFLKSGYNISLASKALTYLVRNKDAFGTWQSTQATVWSLKAFLLALEKSTSEVNAKITIMVNGKQASVFNITQTDSDVLRQIDLRKFVSKGGNNVKIKFEGKGSALYQISSKYYLPWDIIKEKKELLSINVEYDGKELHVNDIVNCKITLTNNQNLVANMVIVDLGLPPGFDVFSEDLADLVGKKIIEKYSLTGRQIIIYLNKVYPGKTVEFSYRLKAKYPIRAKTGITTAYEYYAPTISGKSSPQTLVVNQK